MVQARSGVQPAQELTVRDLEFRRIPIECRGSQGTKYTRWASVGMPVIPPDFLDSVAYLYENEDAARLGIGAGGCGFFVSVPSATHPEFKHRYFVTNYHVAVRDGFSALRVNMRGGGVEVFPFDSSDYEFVVNGGDVAAIESPPFGLTHTPLTRTLAV